MALCGKCEAPVGDKDKFCIQCGSEIIAKLICPKCKKEYTNATKFCPNDGAKITPEFEIGEKSKPVITNMTTSSNIGKETIGVKLEGKKIRATLPRISPASAFGVFMFGFGYIWTIISYFQLCGSINKLNLAAKLKGWTMFVPIYGFLYLSTIVSEMNYVIKKNKLQNVKPIEDNQLQNFILPFLSLYKIFNTYNAMMEELPNI